MKYLLCLILMATLTACGGSDTGAAKATSLQLQDLRGQWVVINYWAKWCKPCLEEIPELNALAEKHPKIVVLGVNYDGATGDELATQAAQFNIKFRLLEEDPAAQLGISRPVVLPTTLLLNPEGQVSKTLVGPQTEQSLLEALESQT